MTGTHTVRAMPKRVVLEGVPRVGFYGDMMQHEDSKMRCPEDVPLPSCLRSCFEYLGDSLGCRELGLCDAERGLFCAYSYLMGTTGAAFLLSWRPGWHADNTASALVSDDPDEPLRRGMGSAGYQCEIIGESELRELGPDGEAYLRSRIVESIRDLARPAIATGVVGPPEECVITGYDEDGDVVIGWSFFQGWPEARSSLEFEPNGAFRKRNWFPDTHRIALIGDKGEPPDRKRVYREAVQWAIDITRAPVRRGDRHNGLAAYDAWADHLLRDADFCSDDAAVLLQRFAAHDDAVSTVAEGRWYASVFLAQAAVTDPGLSAPELYDAASCYAAEHDLMWQIWAQVGGIGHSPEKAAKLADPEVRRRIVPLIQEARAKELEATEHLEEALLGSKR